MICMFSCGNSKLSIISRATERLVSRSMSNGNSAFLKQPERIWFVSAHWSIYLDLIHRVCNAILPLGSGNLSNNSIWSVTCISPFSTNSPFNSTKLADWRPSLVTLETSETEIGGTGIDPSFWRKEFFKSSLAVGLSATGARHNSIKDLTPAFSTLERTAGFIP